jgi:hypothetical protein
MSGVYSYGYVLKCWDKIVGLKQSITNLGEGQRSPD